MNQKQKDKFIEIAQFGVSCGLEHPFEWIENFLYHGLQLCPFEERHELEVNAVDAFVAFYKCCDSYPGEYNYLTRESFMGMVNDWYNIKRDESSKKNT